MTATTQTQRTLATPFTINTVEIPNRLVMTPMGSDLANADGTVGPRLLKYWLERAEGGCGLLITEITRVNDEHGAGTPKQLSVTRDELVPQLAEAIEAVHARGTKIFLQLQHPGNQGIPQLNKGQVTVGPSAVQSQLTKAPVRALENEEVKSLVQDFINGARRAKEAGADGVEIHGAHGYLIDEFLSPHTNKREDEYGGSFENRCRFLVEILDGVREVVGPDFPISVRLSISQCYDLIGMPGEGNEVADGVRIAKLCEEHGADLISVSSGTYETGVTVIEPVNTPRNWRDPMIRAVRDAVSIPVMGVSIIREPEQAEKMLNDGLVDLIAMGRSWLADPQWGIKAIEGRDADITRCIGCMYCFEALFSGGHVECAVNPRCGFESEFPLEPERNAEGRTALVIGGGPAGCEAAETLAKRGAKVTLVEAEDTLGGQVVPGTNPPGKDPMGWLVESYTHRLEQAGVEVRLSTRFSADEVRDFGADAVIVATGAVPVVPPIPGIDGDHVVDAIDVLGGTREVRGRAIVVGSGMTGLETAELIAANGGEVAVYEMAPQLGAGAFHMNLISVTSKLKKAGVPMLTGHRLVEVNDSGAVFEADGSSVNVEAETVVLAIGMRSENTLASELKDAGIDFRTAGDVSKVAKVAQAVATGYRVGLEA
ncbi:NAD(P)/FAD-dependent oxidoreductase [Dermabacter sp. HSID17554]|uniref:NAD(P)/FAD-dependent oxidoreductase n=1 Tax=Dermabacter sp. HSID17554 TaxID=2419511 RepID=UPI000F884767|nr:NAD(P)/FAD-dependent oxidoreductase [Dermabacter sp. HSID17554]RUP85678.1 FAD-dependent oxidoreductase [Dermabacter sp. HSID17554]